jgi:hypothetical protein
MQFVDRPVGFDFAASLPDCMVPFGLRREMTCIAPKGQLDIGDMRRSDMGSS